MAVGLGQHREVLVEEGRKLGISVGEQAPQTDSTINRLDGVETLEAMQAN
jgi:hypothetical protein